MHGFAETWQVGVDYEVPMYHRQYFEQSHMTWQRKIWNRSKKEILGRNGISWAKILLAFILFYLALVTFYIVCWRIYYSTVSSSLPRSTLSQPGLMFVPVCEVLRKYHYIEYCEKYKAEVNCYVQCIVDFLNKYGNQHAFGECTKKNNYGYANRKPCVFLKLNKSIGFKLDPIEHKNDLPSSAPEDLKNYLDTLSLSDRQKRLWISCETSKSEGLVINYFPSRGISANILEIKEKTSQTSKDLERIIAVQFSNMPVNKNIKIKCLAWAKNIERDSSAFVGPGQGYVQIDIKIQT